MEPVMGWMWVKVAVSWTVILVIGVGVVGAVLMPESKAPVDPKAETWAYQTPQYVPDPVPVPKVPAVRNHGTAKGGGVPHIRHHRVRVWRYVKHTRVGNGRCDSCRVVRRIWHFLH